MFSSINKTFGCCSNIFGCSNKKKLFVIPNFVALTKTFFSVKEGDRDPKYRPTERTTLRNDNKTTAHG